MWFYSVFSISSTAPADKSENVNNNNKNKSDDYNYDDYDGDYDETKENDKLGGQAEPETAANRQLATTSSTTTTTFRPIFSKFLNWELLRATILISFLGIPRRSSHVLEPTCPRNCLCLEDFKFVQCTKAQLTHVPLDLPKNVAIIDLSYNEIAELRSEDFANLSKLVEINLNNNLIKQLDKEVNHISYLYELHFLIINL